MALSSFYFSRHANNVDVILQLYQPAKDKIKLDVFFKQKKNTVRLIGKETSCQRHTRGRLFFFFLMVRTYYTQLLGKEKKKDRVSGRRKKKLVQVEKVLCVRGRR